MTSKIIRSDGVTELTGIKSVVYTESVNAGENLKPGCVGSAYIDVEVYGAQSSSPTAGEELSYYQVDDNNNATLIGLFYAEPSVPTKNTYKFVAYDAVSKLDKPYSEHLNSIQTSFPMTVYDLVDDACTFAGVTLGSASWPLSTQTVQEFYADNLTCRNIVMYAAEIAGKFVRCNTSGEVIFDWYTTSSYGIKPGVDTNAVAYKQDGLTYSKYASVAVDAVAVKPVGTEGAAYIYPSSIGTVTATDPNGDGNVILTNLSATDDGSGNIYLNVNAEDDNEDGNVEITNAASAANTLIISGNLLLMNASDATYNAVAQNLYNVMSALPSFRYAEVNLFTGENPFRAGQFVSMTDAQGVSFTSPVFEMKVSAAAAVLRSSGKQTYEEQTTGESKALANLSANIVQLEKLKVGWADIQEAIVQYLKLYGYMEVYKDSTLTQQGGRLGYMAGSHGFPDGSTETTAGMAIVNEQATKTHYLIVTDSGVRMTENKQGNVYKVYLSDGIFRSDTHFFLGSAGRDVYQRFFQYDGRHIDIDFYSFWMPIWENSAPTSTFAAQTVPIPAIGHFNTFLVCCRKNTSVSNETQKICCVPGTDEMGFDIDYSNINDNLNIEVRQRNVYFNRANNTVRFETGYVNGGSATGNGNILIPTRILAMNIPYEFLHSGTQSDPIPYNGSLRLVAGNYYTQNSVLYLCTTSTPRLVYGALSTYVGTYVEVVT